MVLSNGLQARGHVIRRLGDEEQFRYLVQESDLGSVLGDISHEWQAARIGSGDYSLSSIPYSLGKSERPIEVGIAFTQDAAERTLHEHAKMHVGLMDFGPCKDLTQRDIAV